MINSVWPTETLSEVAPSKPLKVGNVDSEEKVWLLNLNHIESGTGKLLELDIQPYSVAGNSTHWFDEHYVLYSKLRPYLNKVLLPNQRGLGTTELIPMLPDKKRLYRKYLAYYLKSKKFVDWVSVQTAGAKMPRVSMKIFWGHKIPLPPLPEQQKIAAILDAADRLRQKDQQLIDHYTTLSQSLFLEMFGDPVTNPMGWDRKKINEVCSDIVDCVNKTATVVGRRTNYKMIRTTNVRNYKVDLSSVRYVEKEIYEKWVRRLTPKRGDIIFTREAPVGEAGILETDDQVFLGQRTMEYRTNSDLANPYFLLYELMGSNLKRQIQKLSSGSTVKHLSVPDCQEFQINAPPIEFQNQFAQHIEKIEQQKQHAQASLEKSQVLFNSLLQRAFKGELTA